MYPTASSSVEGVISRCRVFRGQTSSHMSKEMISSDNVARLTRERETADHEYNRTLSELDASIQTPPDLPHPPPPFDDCQVSPINERWQLVAPEGPDLGTGWRGRLNRLVWRLIGPLLERQQSFNAALVDHVNRNITPAREGQKATTSLIALVRGQLEALETFESRLIQYLQQITPYVDTKDRFMDGHTRAVAGVLDGVADELRKRWESTVVREQRFVQHVEELRTTVGHVQHGLLAVRRELERLASGGGDTPPRDRASAASTARVDEAVDAYTYVGFENLFRGAQEEIRGRLVDYGTLFEGTSDVLDIGCGRGEFLDLLQERGIRAIGVDINREMVEECRSRGLEATVGDAVGHLRELEDGSLGGLFAAQVVEHLEPAYLIRFLGVAFRKLRPGSTIVLETINPSCWFAFFDGYIRDITHVRPLHPDTLKYLLAAAGFQRTSVRYSAPYPEPAKLQHVAAPTSGSGAKAAGRLSAAIDVLNENADKLNNLLFTHMDYAAIGKRV